MFLRDVVLFKRRNPYPMQNNNRITSQYYLTGWSSTALRILLYNGLAAEHNLRRGIVIF